ncbi:hypothetical protein FGO68_gene12526 [Halteria grandinella]|uniref:Right handed beta helix domain-containing protein n=1 Tax=Halteria grandinella TaxID=5974 RepID=A0A8J8P6E3_HALGN|nr:hypothetical protein FGO68_gene12526 [Halteria grandinella]
MLIQDSKISNLFDPNAFSDFVSANDREASYLSLMVGNSMIKLMRTGRVKIFGCEIFGNHNAAKGGFIDLQQQSSVVIQDSTVRDMIALSAGAINVFYKSRIIIYNSTFTRLASFDTGVIEISDDSDMSVSNSRFHHNAAEINGVFKISGDSTFSIVDTTIDKNMAQQNSVGQVIQAKVGGTLTRVSIKDNQAWLTEKEKESSDGITLEILSCKGPIIIDQCDFNDNHAVAKTPNILLSNVRSFTVTNSIFWNSIREKGNLKRIYGGFINIISSSNLMIRQTQFINGTALLGGAIFTWGDTDLLIEDTKFLENTAQKSGGAIQGDSIANLQIRGASLFYRNEASQQGDSILIQNAPLSTISIIGAKFQSNQVSNFIYMNTARSFQILDTSFSLNLNPTLIYNKTAGVHLVDIDVLQLQRSSFTRLEGSNRRGGGALLIEETQIATVGSIGLISDCTFEESRSITSGGGLSVINVEKLEVVKSTFSNNVAEAQGGALLYSCNELPKSCMLVLNGTKFINNTAKIEGGAIKWNYFEPVMIDVIFIGNNANIYGDDIASVARNLVQISEKDVGARRIVPSNQIISQTLGSNILQSGGKSSLYFGLIDKYGSFVRVDSKSKLFIKQGTLSLKYSIQTANYLSRYNYNSPGIIYSNTMRLGFLQSGRHDPRWKAKYFSSADLLYRWR